MISTIVFYAGLALFFLGFLMVIKHGFGGNKIWAICMLLIPIFIIAHIVLFWKDLAIRKATYVLIVAVIMTGVGVFGGALAKVPNLPDTPAVERIRQSTAPDTVPLPNEEQAQAIQLPDGESYDPILSGSTFEDADIEPLSPTGTKPVEQVTMITRTLRNIDIDMLPYVLGRKAQLVLDGDQVETGIVTSVNDEGVVLDQSSEQGAMEFTYVFSRITSAEVMLSAQEFEAAKSQADQVLLNVAPETLEEAVGEVELEVITPEIRVEEVD